MEMGNLPVAANGIALSVGAGIVWVVWYKVYAGFLGKRGIMRIKYGLMIIVLGMLVGQAGAETMAQGLPELKDKHITIHPKKPAKDGINSGLVILFGHPVPPPYKIEYRGEKIFVNDVQAFPSQLWEEQVTVPARTRNKKNKLIRDDMRKHPEKYTPRTKLTDWIRKQCPFEDKSEGQYKDILQHVLAQHEWVDDASWATGHWAMKVNWHGEDGPFYIACERPDSGFQPKNISTSSRKLFVRNDDMVKKTRIDVMENALRADGCVWFPLDDQQHDCLISSTVVKIMLDPALNRSMRYSALIKELPVKLAEELSINYIPKEWNCVKPTK